MAKLYISEFQKVGGDSGSLVPVAHLPPSSELVVAIAAGSTQSAPLRPDTEYVRLVSDLACNISVGTNPTATTSTLLLGAYEPEYFSIPGGSVTPVKIAVILAV